MFISFRRIELVAAVAVTPGLFSGICLANRAAQPEPIGAFRQG